MHIKKLKKQNKIGSVQGGCLKNNKGKIGLKKNVNAKD